MNHTGRTPAAVAVAGAVLLAVALAGCAGGATATGPETAVATTTVSLPKSYKFEPVAITVPVGATVTWTNDDEFTHNVSFDGSEPQGMRPGEQATRTFDQAGTYAYLCTLHPREMQGTVIVTGG